MTDWASLFHSLTADTLDSVDTLDRASTDARQSVNTAQSVNVSEGEEQDVAIPPPAAPFFCPLTADTLDSVDSLKGAPAPGLQSVNTVQSVNCQERKKEAAAITPLAAALAALERRRPDHVESGPWQHAVEDGRTFLLQWGIEAERLGWTEADIFGLPPIPVDLHPSWQRLARVDQLGLVWLTHGRPVTSITSMSATIATRRGSGVTFYRQRARPNFRPQASSI